MAKIKFYTIEEYIKNKSDRGKYNVSDFYRECTMAETGKKVFHQNHRYYIARGWMVRIKDKKPQLVKPAAYQLFSDAGMVK